MKHPIDTMDPLSLQIKINGIRQKKKEFTDKTKIKKYDLLIAHCPCEALEIITNKAIAEQKEFSVQMCQCCLKDNQRFLYRRDWLYYVDSIFDKASILEDAGFIIEKTILIYHTK